jgi:hypothetical protein
LKIQLYELDARRIAQYQDAARGILLTNIRRDSEWVDYRRPLFGASSKLKQVGEQFRLGGITGTLCCLHDSTHSCKQQRGEHDENRSHKRDNHGMKHDVRYASGMAASQARLGFLPLRLLGLPESGTLSTR